MVGKRDTDYRLHGVGINDAPEKISRIHPLHRCYQSWSDVLKRSYSKSLKAKRPTYAEVTCCNDWLRFTNFHSWWQDQEVPDHWELDKDIIGRDSKIYCPENCVYVEQALNCFTTETKSNMGKFPSGITYDKDYNNYRARCNSYHSGKRIHIGRFKTVEDAHYAYLEFKHNQALLWISEIESNNLYKRKDELCSALYERYKPINHGY